MKKALGLGLAFLFLFGGVIAIWAAVKLSQKPEFEEVRDPFAELERIDGIDDPWLKRFTLIKRSGKPFESEELKGQISVTCFFYASCPASCWKQNLAMKSIQEDFGDEVKLLSITCDPDQDDHLALASYAQKLGAETGWYFLTGDMKYIRRIGAEIYRLPVDKQTHVDVFAVTDEWGNLRDSYKWKEASEMARLRRDLKSMLAEAEPPAPTSTSPLPGPTVPPIGEEEAEGEETGDAEAAEAVDADAEEGEASDTESEAAKPEVNETEGTETEESEPESTEAETKQPSTDDSEGASESPEVTEDSEETDGEETESLE